MSTIYTDSATGRHYTVNAETGQSEWQAQQPPPPPPPPSSGSPVPTAPVAPKKKHRIRTTFLALAGVVVVIAVINSMNGSSSGQSPTGGATAGSTTAAQAKTARIGTPVRDGNFEFTVTKVQSGVASVGTGSFGQKAQGQYVILSVTVKNIGTDARTFDGSSQTLYDTQGRKFSADSAAAIYLDQSNSFLTSINPGNSVSGMVLFDVPKGTALAKVALHDSMFSNGVDVSLS